MRETRPRQSALREIAVLGRVRDPVEDAERRASSAPLVGFCGFDPGSGIHDDVRVERDRRADLVVLVDALQVGIEQLDGGGAAVREGGGEIGIDASTTFTGLMLR